jgi:uncharacterized membrane protein
MQPAPGCPTPTPPRPSAKVELAVLLTVAILFGVAATALVALLATVLA